MLPLNEVLTKPAISGVSKAPGLTADRPPKCEINECKPLAQDEHKTRCQSSTDSCPPDNASCLPALSKAKTEKCGAMLEVFSGCGALSSACRKRAFQWWDQWTFVMATIMTWQDEALNNFSAHWLLQTLSVTVISVHHALFFLWLGKDSPTCPKHIPKKGSHVNLPSLPLECANCALQLGHFGASKIQFLHVCGTCFQSNSWWWGLMFLS